MRSGEPKSARLATPRAPTLTVTFLTRAPTRAGVRAVPAAVAALREMVLTVPAVTLALPATITTEAEPSGQRDTTDDESAGSSAEARTMPVGTRPSSGYTAAM